jgi:hypothetical protein
MAGLVLGFVDADQNPRRALAAGEQPDRSAVYRVELDGLRAAIRRSRINSIFGPRLPDAAMLYYLCSHSASRGLLEQVGRHGRRAAQKKSPTLPICKLKCGDAASE